MLLYWIGGAALAALAFANGANDNAKPVATLVGAGLASPRGALVAGTLATLAGSLAALALGGALVASFSAKGIVGGQVATEAAFQVSVAAGAAGAVLLATRWGLPISTTHALVGAIAGAALMGASIDWGRLAAVFALPLLVSPLLALFLTAALYPGAHRLRERLGIGKQSCICVGGRWVPALAGAPGGAAPQLSASVAAVPALSLTVGEEAECRERYGGSLLGVGTQWLVESAHWLSALAVSFARGLQDGAKIAGIALAVLGASYGAAVAVGVALCMAAGGLLAARRVEQTMASRVTPMNDGQGLLSNLVSSVLILGASRVGVPVSTTHVTTGGLMGIRLHNRAPAESWLGRILLSWVATLPLAAGLGALVGWLLL